MAGCLSCTNCFYCERILSPRHEHDHFPVPRRRGGSAVVPACMDCHHLKDRVVLDQWPIEALGGLFHALSDESTLAFACAMVRALPRDIQARFDFASMPAAPPIEDWADDDVLGAITRVPNLEARLFLAKAYALTLDAMASGSGQLAEQIDRLAE